MNKHNDKFEAAVKAFSQGTIPQGPSDDLVRQTLERIEQTNTHPLLERIFNMKPLTKIAAAAIVIIGISAVFLFPTGGKSIALAAVYDKVLQSQAFVYQMSMTITGMGELVGQPAMNGSMEMNVTVTISEDYGMKMENHMTMPAPGGQTQNISQFAYLLPDEKVMVSILPEQKMYQTIEFTDDLLEQTKKQNNDPREMIKQMMGCDYVELPDTEINGVQVQGFHTADPDYSMGIANEVDATLWVDVDTWLPVKYEMTMKMGENAEAYCVIDQFNWNVPVTAADFEYTIPDDYTTMGTMKMPPMDEESAVDGLRTYLDFFGQYPEKLDLMSLMTSFQKLDDQETEFAKAFREKIESAGNDQAAIQGFMQEFIAPIQSLGMFQMKLMQEKKDPAYYGNLVTPDDTDAVLYRWKNDDGTYTVIFGDLSSGEMTYEDLIKIEPENVPDDNSIPNGDLLTEDLAKVAETAGQVMSTQMRVESAQNIKQLLLACIQYAQNNDGQWPQQLEDLLSRGIDPQTLINPACPDNPNGYIFVPPVPDSPIAETIVIYEAYDEWNDGINAGFADSHVEFIKNEADFLERLSQ
jgi:outer membrane lipoprotein-sorting protein